MEKQEKNDAIVIFRCPQSLRDKIDAEAKVKSEMTGIPIRSAQIARLIVGEYYANKRSKK